MARSLPILLIFAASQLFLSSCGYLRIDPLNVLVRSDVITTPEKEREIVSRAKLGWTDDHRVRVLFVSGTPYERGYQQGVLLRQEVQDNLGYLYKQALKQFRSEELFAEVYERMRPYMPAEYVEEMHGLAHGSRLPLNVIHHIHVLADLGEWGGKKNLKTVVKKMMDGEPLGTMCSNVGASGNATVDGKLYTVRILDWGLHKISKLHQYPLITIGIPDKGVPYANIGWVGYLGAVSGMNSQGITLGEMGYRDPPSETLRGQPMPFVLRDVLTYASNLKDVRRILSTDPGSNSYVFMMSDGKTKEAEFYVRDPERFLVFHPGETVNDNKEFLPGINDVTYGGRYNDRLTSQLTANYGKLSPQYYMETMIPAVAMKSNFQNVIYSPSDLQFWVSNARGKDQWAASSPYTFFDFGKALREWQLERP